MISNITGFVGVIENASTQRINRNTAEAIIRVKRGILEDRLRIRIHSANIDLQSVIKRAKNPVDGLGAAGLLAKLEGSRVLICGEIKTERDVTNHMKIFVLCEWITEAQDTTEDQNKSELQGFVCREPYFRRTPKGKRVCDVLLAVNTENGSSYIPMIMWGKEACKAAHYQIGQEIRVEGQLQSHYKKDGSLAYEFNVFRTLPAEV